MSDWKPPADAKPVEGWKPPQDAVVVDPKPQASTPMTTPLPGAAAGPSIGSGMQQAASQEPSGPPPPTDGRAFTPDFFADEPTGTPTPRTLVGGMRGVGYVQGVPEPGGGRKPVQQAVEEANFFNAVQAEKKNQRIAPLMMESEEGRTALRQLVEDVNLSKSAEGVGITGPRDPGSMSPQVFAQYQQVQFDPTMQVMDPRMDKIHSDFEVLAPKVNQRKTQFSPQERQERIEAGTWQQDPKNELNYQADALQFQGRLLAGRKLKLMEQVQAGADPASLQAEAADIDAGEQYVREKLTELGQRDPRSFADKLREESQAVSDKENSAAGDAARGFVFSAAGTLRSGLAGAARLIDPGDGYTFSDKLSDWASNIDKDRAALRSKENKDSILGKLADGAGSMTAYILGGGTGTPAMVATALTTEYEGFVRQAMDQGATEDQAEAAGLAYAPISAAIELVNPQTYFANRAGMTAVRKTFIDMVKSGARPKEALKYALDATEGGLREALEELSQTATERATNYAVNQMAGTDLNTSISAKEAGETVLISSLLGGAGEVANRATTKGERSRLQAEAMMWAAKNPDQAKSIAAKVAPAEADAFGERLDKLTRTYNGNNLTEQKPKVAAKVADLVHEKQDVETAIKEAPMDPSVEAAVGDPRKRKAAELTTAMIETMGIPADKAKAALIGAGMEKAPEGTKAITNPDGSVTLEKKPETGGAKAATEKSSAPTAKKETTSKAVESVFSADEATGEEPTTNEDQLTPKAPAAAQAEDTGAPASVPAPEQPTRVEPVLTQDVPDDRVSLAAAYEQARMEHGNESDPDAVLSALTAGDVSIKSYERWGDKNNVAKGIAKQYLRTKGRDIDEIAQEASGITGQEISPEDVAAFMERFPSGRPQRSPRMVELDQRHGALYGTKLNKLAAKSILAKHKGEIPRFTPQEQAIADEAEQQGVALTELDDQDSEDYDNMTDEEDDIMFGGGPSTTTKFDLNAKRGTEQTQPGGTPEAQGEVRRDEGTGTPEEQRLAAEAKRARAERDRFVADWNERGQGLFAPEEGMAQQTIDGGFDNSQENFDARVEPLNEKVRQADKALADYVNSAASRAQAAAQQTSIGDQIRSFKIKTDGTAGSYIIPPQILNGALEVAALFADAGSTIAEAGQKAIDYVRGTEWFRSLSSKDKTSAIDQLRELLDKPRRGPLSQNQIADDEDIMPLRQVGDAIGGLMEMDDYGNAYDAAIDRTIDLIQEARSKLSVTNVNAVLDKALAFAREEVQFVREEQGALDANEQEVWKRVFQALKALKEDPSIGRPVVRTLSPRTEKGSRVIDDSEASPRRNATYQTKARKAAAILERAKLKPDQLYALPLPPSVWNGAIRAMQGVIIAGGKAVDAIAAAIKHIQASDWWKNKATQKEKDEVMSHMQGRISDLETAIAAEDVASLKQNIQQARATGAQKTRTKQQEARKEFVQKVKDALKPLHGRMTPAQVKSITAAAAKVNPASPQSVSRFERVAAKVMTKANYADDLSKAKASQKRAKKLAKQADVPLNHREALKAIAKVDVGMLNDPAEFTGPVLDYLQQFGAIGKSYQPGSSEAIIDAMGKLQEQTMAEYRNMLLEEFGVEAGSVDPQQLYDALESDDFDAFAKNLEESKRKEVADAIRQVADYSKMGLESYENDDLSATEKKTLDTLRSIDIDLLSTDQQKDYIKTADNITLNDAFYGAGRMEAVAKATEGLAAAEKAVKSTPLRKVWTTPLKEMYQQQFASVSGMFRFLFGQGEGMAKFHDAIGMTDLILGKKKVDDAVSNAGEKMADFYTGLRKKYKDADTDTMRAAEGIAAYVLQPIPNIGLEESFALRKQQVADSIAAKSERTKRQDEAEVEQRAFDLVLNEATTRDELIRAMKAKAPSAWASVEFLANQVLAPHSKEVLEHRENFWNEAVDVDNPMYLPISYRFLTSAQIAEDAPGQFGAAEKLRKPKESANLIKRESVKTLPKDRVIDMNIRRNTLNALERNLYDTYTSPAWQRMREFFRLPAASKVVGGLDNSDFMQSRLNDLRSAQMREGSKADNLERAVSAITNTVRKAASQIALGGFTQAIKQPADQLTSAMVNVGPEWVGKSIMEVNKAEPLLQLTSIGDRGELIGGTNWDNTLEAETAAMARALKGNKMERFEAATESYRRLLMAALTKSDVLSARTAWLAYYQKYLADKGIEVSNWQQEADMVKEGDPVRRQALAFAEVNADITQGSSDPTKQAKLGQRSPQAWANLLKAAFNPFSSFTIGMRERIINDASDLMFYGGRQMYDTDGKRTKEGDRAATAGRSLAATLASNIMFTVAKVYIAKSLIALGAEGIRAAFAAAAGDDDDDKQKGMAMMSLMMNILYTMRLMDADVYRMFSTAYRDEKKESKMSESKKLDAEQEKALRNAKNAYTSIMQSMLVSGFSPFAENALVDGVNWGSYMMQGAMGELPTTKSTGAPMKYDYWVKQPEYPPLYRYGQGYHESNYGVFSVILDRASELQEQAKDAAGFGKASGPSVESPDDAKKRIEAMAKAAAQ